MKLRNNMFTDLGGGSPLPEIGDPVLLRYRTQSGRDLGPIIFYVSQIHQRAYGASISASQSGCFSQRRVQGRLGWWQLPPLLLEMWRANAS